MAPSHDRPSHHRKSHERKPSSTQASVRFLVFDVESVADGELVSQVRYPSEDLDPSEAVARFRAERLEAHGTDFIPHTYQIPVSVVVAKVDGDFQLLDLVALDEPDFRSHVMTENFWRGWEAYKHPTLVSFNGRGFDIPLLEMAAFRYGVGVHSWFRGEGKTWEQPRNRFNRQAHMDLQDLMVNFGATRFSGGLNLAATLLGKPGKMAIQGDMVQGMYDEGNLAEINDYCRCDVLDTYFVFLRYLVISGELSLHREQELVAASKEWLLERASETPALATYLDHWHDWVSPWKENENAETTANA